MEQHAHARFFGQAAIVTGAGGGIGAAIAEQLAAEGAVVAAFDQAPAAVEKVVGRIRELGGEAEAHVVDVSDGQALKDAIHVVHASTGRLDHLVNNAGITNSPFSLHDLSEDEFDRVIAVTLKSVFLGMHHAIPLMRAAGHGAIVNVASTAGRVGYAQRGAYTAAKHGVLGLTKTAAVENLDVPVRVNAVCPGVIDTPISRQAYRDLPPEEAKRRDLERLQRQPLGRYGEPTEIASLVTFLLSKQASFLTGGVYDADGGLLAGVRP